MSNRHSSTVDRQSDDELISAWLDGRLADAERVVFEARLRAEPVLKRRVDTTRLLIDTARTLPAQPLPRDFTIPLPVDAPHRAPSRVQVSPLKWFLRVGSALAAAVFVIAIGLDLAGLSARPVVLPAPAPQAAFVAPPAQSEASTAADAARVEPAESGAAAPPATTPQAESATGEQSTQAMRQAAEPAAEAPEAQPAPEQPQPLVAPKAAPQAAPGATPQPDAMQQTVATEAPAPQADALSAPLPAETPQTPDAMTYTGEPAAQPDTTPWRRIVAGVALVLAVSLGVLGWRRS